MALKVEDIHTFYGKSYVLQGVSLEVANGKIVVVLGKNGMGKTTLIRSIMGLTPINQGRIVLKGVDLTAMPPHLRVRKGLGLVPQGREIFPSLNVLENLLINARPQTLADLPTWDLDRIFNQFPSLKRRMSNKGDRLSGGEQQMLAIGRALMGNPVFLLMDEPSEGLAPIIVQEIATLIGELKAHGLSILLVEQNFNFAMETADHVYIMNKGHIVHECAPKELVNDEETRERYLGI